jgi:hypothetical protein
MLILVSQSLGMQTNWKALILTTPAIPELGTRDVTVTHNNGMMFFATSQPNIVAVNVIFRLDKPFTWPKRERFTEKDIETLAELVADKPVSNGLLFSDIWKKRQRATIVSLEEGVLNHFHHGRICLIGDAAHKVCSQEKNYSPSPQKVFFVNLHDQETDGKLFRFIQIWRLVET